IFVIDDRTEIGDDDLDQWLAFHLPAPVAPRASEPGLFDAGRPGTAEDDKLAGTFAVVKPAGAATKTLDLYDRHRVIEVQVRPSTKDKAQRWLSVVDAAPTAPGTTKVRPLEGAHGAVIESATGMITVTSAAG